MKFRELFTVRKLPSRPHGGAGAEVQPGSKSFPPRSSQGRVQSSLSADRRSLPGTMAPRGILQGQAHDSNQSLGVETRPRNMQSFGGARTAAPDPFQDWLQRGSVSAFSSATASPAGQGSQNHLGEHSASISFVEREFDRLSGALSTPGEPASMERIAAFRRQLTEVRNQIHPPGTLVRDPEQKKALGYLDVLQRQVDTALESPPVVPEEWQLAPHRPRASAGNFLKKFRSTEDLLRLELRERERHQLVNRLFPDGIENARVYQGALTNCAYVAAFLAISLNQPQRIDQAIQLGRRPGEAKIKLKNCPSVYVDLNKFEPLAMRGDLGSQVFERVFAHNQKTFLSRSSEKILKNAGGIDNIWKDFFSGQQYRYDIPLWKNHPNGPLIAGNFSPSQWSAIEQSLHLMAQDRSGILGTFALKPAHMSNHALVDRDGYDLSIRGKHAFAIVQVDAKQRMMLLCDPKIPGSRQWLGFDEAFHIGSKFDFVDARRV